MTPRVVGISLLMLAAIALTPLTASAQSGSGTRAPTVKDTVEMTRIVSLNPGLSDRTDFALKSPDGANLVFLTRTADVRRNVQVEKLLVYTRADLEAFLSRNPSREAPSGRSVAQVSVQPGRAGIRNVRWTVDGTLTFIAPGENGVSQGYESRERFDRAVQVTRSPTDVVVFASARHRSVYYRKLFAPKTAPVVDVVRDGSEIYAPDADTYHLQLTIQEQNGPGNDVGVPVYLNDPRVWISGTGDEVVTIRPAINAPARWAAYDLRNNDIRWTADKVSSDPTDFGLALRVRYEAVDIKARRLLPLVDGPIAIGSYAQAPIDVAFAEPGRVLLGHQWLPLDGKRSDYDMRTTFPAIAEVDIRTGRVRAVLYEPDSYARDGNTKPLRVVERFSWNQDQQFIRVDYRVKGPKHVSQEARPTPTGWQFSAEAESGGGMAAVPALLQEENLNSRPRIFARGGDCACSRMVFDPAPQADTYSFGRVEEIQWPDRNGTKWSGLLVEPVGYQAGIKYPLIVQTRGYTPGQFLLDGPHHDAGTAFAAQVLANQGFFVLQVQDAPPAAWTDDEREPALTAEGFRAAVEMLTQRPDIDKANVGIIAFSRTGLSVPLLIADNPKMFRAAIFSDIGWWTYTNQVNYVLSPFADVFRKVQGGWKLGDDPAKWFSRSPLYRLPEASTAIRLEATGGRPAVAAHLEYYSLLRARNRPVDFVYYPGGDHNLMGAQERAASQQGTVDWFAYWLQDREIDSSGKREQYDRWRPLKALLQP